MDYQDGRDFYEQSDEGNNETALAINSSGDRVGCCVYRPEDGCLSIATEFAVNSIVNYLDNILAQFVPRLILTTNRFSEDWATKLDQLAANGSVEVKTRHKEDFNSSCGIDALTKMDLLSDVENKLYTANPTNGDEAQLRTDQTFRLGALIDLESTISVGCAGALLRYIQRTDMLETRSQPDIAFIETMNFDNVMSLSADFFSSMQVFEDDMHPSRQLASGKSKEGVSLFGLLDQTASRRGKLRLRQWLSMPMIKKESIESRLDLVSLLVTNSSSEAFVTLRKAIRGAGDVQLLLSRFVGQVCHKSAREWSQMRKFLDNNLKIRDACASLSMIRQHHLFAQFHNEIDASALTSMLAHIASIIDFEESSIQGRCVVASGIDSELDRRRDIYWGLDDLLSQVAEALAASLSLDEMLAFSCVYVPQIGFLITAAQCYNDLIEAELLQWTYQFESDDKAFYKSAEMQELDDHLGDVLNEITSKEIEILFDAQRVFYENSPMLLKCADLISELDCYMSFACAAKNLQYVRPSVTQDNVLSINQGRHPLQELCVNDFVPNDLKIDEEHQAPIKLLTGANQSGKSIFLKQTALIVYMAHIGCPVPATSATIGLTDKILTRVQTKESVAKNSSAFMIDLQQMFYCLRSATSKSLIIIDEFGKGTDPHDGAALFGAVLAILAESEKRSKVIAATHFYRIICSIGFAHSEIIDYLNLGTCGRIDFLQTDICVSEDQKDALCSFKIQDGTSHSSYATRCAAIAGIDSRVIERALGIVDLLGQGVSILDVCWKMTGREKQALKRAEMTVKNFLSWSIDAESPELVRQRLEEVLDE